MARGSYGAWPARSADFAVIRDVAVEILEADGYRVSKRRVTEQEVKVEGIRGSKALASLVQMLPFGPLLGFGTRVRATVRGRASLTDGDTDCRLAVRCAPIMELDSMEEEFHSSQGRLERVGDHAQARRCFGRLVDALKRARLIG